MSLTSAVRHRAARVGCQQGCGWKRLVPARAHPCKRMPCYHAGQLSYNGHRHLPAPKVKCRGEPGGGERSPEPPERKPEPADARAVGDMGGVTRDLKPPPPPPEPLLALPPLPDRSRSRSRLSDDVGVLGLLPPPILPPKLSKPAPVARRGDAMELWKPEGATPPVTMAAAAEPGAYPGDDVAPLPPDAFCASEYAATVARMSLPACIHAETSVVWPHEQAARADTQEISTVASQEQPTPKPGCVDLTCSSAIRSDTSCCVPGKLTHKPSWAVMSARATASSSGIVALLAVRAASINDAGVGIFTSRRGVAPFESAVSSG
jgi:hypothetical protein